MVMVKWIHRFQIPEAASTAQITAQGSRWLWRWRQDVWQHSLWELSCGCVQHIWWSHGKNRRGHGCCYCHIPKCWQDARRHGQFPSNIFQGMVVHQTTLHPHTWFPTCSNLPVNPWYKGRQRNVHYLLFILHHNQTVNRWYKCIYTLFPFRIWKSPL